MYDAIRNLACYFLLFGTLMSFTGCGILLGFREPRPLDTRTINKLEESFRFDNLYQYAMDSTALEQQNQANYKPGWEKGFRPLQFKVFDKSGKLIAQYSTCEGSFSRFKGLTEFPPHNTVNPQDTSTTLDDELRYLKPRQTALIHTEKYDLTYVLYWADWLGSPSRKLVKRVRNYQQQYPDKNIAVVLVNVLEYE